jgi:phosphate transport system permease protein
MTAPAFEGFGAKPLDHRNRRRERLFRLLFGGMTALLILPVVIILAMLVARGYPALSWEFFTDVPRNGMTEGGIFPALIGTLWLVAVALIASVPLGVAAAVYLSEYASDNLLTRLINLAIINLAGVPSIVHALFGVGAFVLFFEFGTSILAASLTLAVMTLPVVIVSTREALQAVPQSFREACWSLGATRWQTIRQVVLPEALPGILTGCILSLSRAMGETAPLVVVGALSYVTFLPDGIDAPFSALPIQIFNWVSRPQKEFLVNAAAAIVVLLTMMLFLNAAAILLRDRMQQKRGRPA